MPRVRTPGSDEARFADRAAAGRALAARLAPLRAAKPIVYALPRGGVPVATEIAAALAAPLDLLLVRKLGAPRSPEVALGAVVEGTPPETVRNPRIIAATGADEAFISEAREAALAEIARRRARYLAGRSPLDPRGRTVIVVDDGLATGATARAALVALRRRGAARLILAVPVAPADSLEAMQGAADEIACLHVAAHFGGVGAFYDDFHQLSDEEVVQLLAAAG
jgi:predicted phosphoribosyltransferase